MQSCIFLYLDKKPVLNLTPGVAAPPGEAGGRYRVALPAEGGVAAGRPSHLGSVHSGQQHQVRYTHHRRENQREVYVMSYF
jgi:hypothetical protein